MEFEAPEKLMGAGTTATPTAFPYCGKPIELKSWKGDSLSRADTAQGVTTWSTGIGNLWTVVESNSGNTTRQKGDILVSRFFAPKIVNFSVAPEKRDVGWRRLVRINSRPHSEAAKHHVESAWILFNHFTSPPVHSPYGGTPPTEQLKDSPWGKVKIVTPGDMKNSSVNTQVALVTHCKGTQEECAEVDSIYWVDFGPSDKGYKLSYQLDAFFDAGNLVAAGDTAGQAPYFVPNGCDTCHGSLKGQAILNLLDTDHWMDRLTDGDFPALAKPEPPRPEPSGSPVEVRLDGHELLRGGLLQPRHADAGLELDVAHVLQRGLLAAPGEVRSRVILLHAECWIHQAVEHLVMRVRAIDSLFEERGVPHAELVERGDLLRPAAIQPRERGEGGGEGYRDDPLRVAHLRPYLVDGRVEQCPLIEEVSV